MGVALWIGFSLEFVKAKDSSFMAFWHSYIAGTAPQQTDVAQILQRIFQADPNAAAQVVLQVSENKLQTFCSLCSA